MQMIAYEKLNKKENEIPFILMVFTVFIKNNLANTLF